MKKLIFSILIICLLTGIPLMVMDTLSDEKSTFIVPSGYKTIEIDLGEKARNNDVVFSTVLNEAEVFDIYLQSDSDESKDIMLTSDHKIIGQKGYSSNYQIGKVINHEAMGSKYILNAGQITITLTSAQAKGKLLIAYRENAISPSGFERLSKIDNGELNNPPEGYQEVYSIDLSGLNCKDKNIYTLTLDKTQNIGLSIYTDSKHGNVSVDFVGMQTNYYGLVYSQNNSICDQLEQVLGKGEYEIRLNSENADGQLYVFIKQ